MGQWEGQTHSESRYDFFNPVNFYKERIDRDLELKNMILGKVNVEAKEVSLQ